MAKGGIMMQNDSEMRTDQAGDSSSLEAKSVMQSCKGLKADSIAIPMMLNNRCGALSVTF